MLKMLLQGLADLIYPPVCLLCQKGMLSASDHSCLCSACSRSIEFNHPPFCPRCCSSLLENQCPRCSHSNFHFDRAWSICSYNESLRRLIHLFKYGQKIGLRREFSRFIFDFTAMYKVDLKEYDLIVPIPLHPARLRERGYNQSQLLAETMAQAAALPLNIDLKRIRHTAYQASCSQKDRWTNISGAFTIKHPLKFSKQRVLVVDDLMTTGATVSEAAATLKKAGAAKVDVLTLAAAQLN